MDTEVTIDDTVADTRAGPATLDLGTAGDFAILAKSGISTTGTTLITGDIGVSPIDRTALTGFSETMDSTNEFSTSAYVVGNLYASDYAPPTPTKMSTAISDMETAYTTAAGLTLPNATELGAGDITGLTIAPGLYKWSTGVLISAAGVTLNGTGGSNDVWIFQIAQDLTVASGAQVYLSGGAQAKNIFWQVGGGTGVALGTTSIFNGNILAMNAININTGATLNGRALAQKDVTLIANAVTVPSPVPISVVFPPLVPYWENTSPRTINATGSANSDAIELYYRFSTDNTTWGGWTLFGNDTASPWSWNFTFTNGSGHYQFYTRAWNRTTGLKEDAPAVADARCGYDIIAPTSSVDTIAPYWMNTNLTVTANASDALSGVKNVSLYYRYAADNVTWGGWTQFGVDLNTSWNWTFTFGNGTGFYQFYTRSHDNLTNFEAAPLVADQICGYDIIGPNSSVDAIDPYWKSTSITVTATANDTASGVKNVTLYYRYSSNNITWGGWTEFGVDLAAPWSWAFTFGNGSGYYQFYTRAIDNMTYFEAAPLVADQICGYDIIGPTSSVDTITPYWKNTNLTVTATAADALSGVKNVTLYYRYSANNNTWGGWTEFGVDLATPWSWTFTFGNGSGYYQFYTRAIDNMAFFEAAPLMADQICGYDFTAPTVSSTIPANSATDVAINSAMTATFSEAMVPSTITATTFTLKQGTTLVPGTVSYSGVTATFTPTDDLEYSTTYTATITTGVLDRAGNGLAVDKVWTFTTGAAPDTTAPTVSSTIPANGRIGVTVNSAIAAIFSEPMDPLTITTTTFTLKQGTTPVPGTVSYSVVTATFTPTDDLEYSTAYTGTITTDVMDLAGNGLAVDKEWTFTTGTAPDVTAPTVSSTIPANTATGVAINSAIAAIFSEPMDPLTITTTTFTLKEGTTVVQGDVIYAGVTATFTPTDDLEYSTTYTATITTDVMDLAGNGLAVDKVWTFTTGAAPDTTAPTVGSTIPANEGMDVTVNSAIAAIFSEPMDPLTITTATFTLKQGITPVQGDVIYAGVTATFTPTDALLISTEYTATITTGAKDLAGNRLAANMVWTFTTGTTPDVVAPTVSSTIPANTATGVAINSAIAAIFSEPMDPMTITTATFTLVRGALSIPGAVTYEDVIATFTPESALEAETMYTVTIKSWVTDLAGNAMEVSKVWSFTTGNISPEGAVDLFSAADLVILAKTGISNTGPTLITGDIGVSPIAHTAITGFSETMDSTNQFSTSKYVIGKLFAADYANPTPAKMTTAVSDMLTAYTDAAGRTLPDATELGAGDITGMTITPGLYKWSTGVLISAAGVTLSGGANDVWIFQIAGDLTVANGAVVTLSGGARSSNIFWQVAGGAGATLGTTSVFNGNILAKKAIVLQTGATLNGRAMAQTAVTLDANNVQAMSDVLFNIRIGPLLYSDNTPAADLTVILGSGTRGANEEMTDSEGYVEFKDKAPGDYEATVVGPVDSVSFDLTLTPTGETVYSTLPQLTPASGEEITVTIGPVKDTDGNILEGAEVTLVIDGQTYTSTTDASGNAVFQLPVDSKGKTMHVTITKNDYNKEEYDTTLGQDGEPADPTPAMEKVEKEGEWDDLIKISLIAFIIILVVLMIIVFAMFFKNKENKQDQDDAVVMGAETEDEEYEE